MPFAWRSTFRAHSLPWDKMQLAVYFWTCASVCWIRISRATGKAPWSDQQEPLDQPAQNKTPQSRTPLCKLWRWSTIKLRIYRSASKISFDLLNFHAQKYDFIGRNKMPIFYRLQTSSCSCTKGICLKTTSKFRSASRGFILEPGGSLSDHCWIWKTHDWHFSTIWTSFGRKSVCLPLARSAP